MSFPTPECISSKNGNTVHESGYTFLTREIPVLKQEIIFLGRDSSTAL